MSRLGSKAAQAKRRAAVDAALIAGYRTRDIQGAYKVSATMVRQRRVALGLPPAQRGRRRGDFDATTRSPVTDEIIDRITRMGRSDIEAARELGLNPATVQYARERWVLGLARASRRK